jgi:hypothetical protein
MHGTDPRYDTCRCGRGKRFGEAECSYCKQEHRHYARKYQRARIAREVVTTMAMGWIKLDNPNCHKRLDMRSIWGGVPAQQPEKPAPLLLGGLPPA